MISRAARHCGSTAPGSQDDVGGVEDRLRERTAQEKQ